MAEFLAMGGYAAYVWPAFGFTILVLAGLWVLSLRQMRA
ncbi:heme exporter protein CcmD, partial [Geminicoccus flavidas]